MLLIWLTDEKLFSEFSCQTITNACCMHWMVLGLMTEKRTVSPSCFSASSMNNPWDVSALEDFNFLCCPECQFRSKDPCEFECHAVGNHPKAKTFFVKNIKSEPSDDDIDPDLLQAFEGTCEESLDPIKIDDQDNLFKCTYQDCEKVFTSHRLFKRHLDQEHEDDLESDDKWKCTECGKSYDSRTKLNAHKKYHNKEPCEGCGNHYNIYYLKDHKTFCKPYLNRNNPVEVLIKQELDEDNVVIPDQDPLMESSTPSIKSENQSYLKRTKLDKRHGRELAKVIKMSHLGFECDQCSQMFKTSAQFNAHFEAFHIGSVNRVVAHEPKIRTSWDCQECKYSFDNPKDYNIHFSEVHILGNADPFSAKKRKK